MPIYLYKCEKCGYKLEVLGGGIPLCCGKAMTKQITTHAMFKMKGEGGFPSRVKEMRNSPTQ